jgi:tryptophanyl-tRNA synthetase
MKLFATPARMAEIHNLYINGGAAYGYLKLELLDMLNDKFGAARKKKAELLGDPAMLRAILGKGRDKAREKAVVTLDLVRDRVGLKY